MIQTKTDLKKDLLKYPFFLSLLYILVIYLPVNYLGPINFDDVEVLARIQANFSNIQWDNLFFRPSLTRYYRPLLEVLCYFDYALWGSALSAWHLTNYVLHILNAVLVYLIACAWFKPVKDFKLWAVAAMLIFALNPLACESVAWISGRSDLAATFFALISVWAYYLRNRLRFIVSPIAILAGLLCKESALAVIPIIVLLEGSHHHRKGSTFKQAAKGCLFWSCLVLISLILYLLLRTNGLEHQTYVHAKAVAPMVSGKDTLDMAYVKNFLNLAPVTAFYIKKLFIPFPLNFAITKINTIVYSFLFVGIVGINVFYLIRKNWAVPFFSILIVTSFSPALIVAMGGVSWVSLAERYVYMSLIIMAIGLTSFFLRWYERQLISTNLLVVILVSIILIWSLPTLFRQFDFNSSQAIWTHTLKRNPDNGNVLFMYGSAVRGIEGQRAYHKALEISEPYGFKYKTHFNVAQYESEHGNHETAVEHIEKALDLKSSYNSYTWASMILLNFGSMNGNVLDKKYVYKAVDYLKKANAQRESVYTLNEIAAHLAYLGEVDQANRFYREIIEKYPDSKYAGYAKKQLAK